MKRTYICIVLIFGTIMSLQIVSCDNETSSSTEQPKACKDSLCELTCPDGFKKDSTNCTICECITNEMKIAPQKCPSTMCRTYCEQGYKKTADGCDTCDCIEESVWESREFDVNHAHHLQVINQTFNLINLTWFPPNVTTDKLNNYKVYYFNQTSMATGSKPACPNGLQELQTKLVLPTSTVVEVKGLKMGTTYGFCVQTNYSSGQVTTSHLISATTLGVGPSNPCQCPKTKYIDYHRPCDPLTGKCRCKTKYQTGDNCDKCVDGYYMSKDFGCNDCHCYGNNTTGNCILKNHAIGGQTVQCECRGNYGGMECSICKGGYYMDSSIKDCTPCLCTNNSNVCDYLTGECSECGYNTTGDHCEKCLNGYLGDAYNRTCALPPPPPTQPSAASPLLHPATATHEIAVIAVICVSVALLFVLIAVLIIYCARRARGKPFQFWSVQMRGGGREDISFSPMSRNSDLCLLSDDGVQYFERDENPGNGRLEFLGGSQIFKAQRT